MSGLVLRVRVGIRQIYCKASIHQTSSDLLYLINHVTYLKQSEDA